LNEVTKDEVLKDIEDNNANKNEGIDYSTMDKILMWGKEKGVVTVKRNSKGQSIF
jgi:hypothetical protein